MEGGPSNLAFTVDSLFILLYAFDKFDMMMQAPLCALLFLSFFDLGNFVKPHHYQHPKGLLNYIPYFLVVENINTSNKLLDTNTTLTCPPTLPHDKGIWFS